MILHVAQVLWVHAIDSAHAAFRGAARVALGGEGVVLPVQHSMRLKSWHGLEAPTAAAPLPPCLTASRSTRLHVLQYFGADTMSPWAYLGIEAAFFVLFFGLAVLSLTYVRHDKR